MTYERTFQIGRAIVVADYVSGYVETRYEDGAVCQAFPHDTDAYRETATALGYGSDTAAMTREHEVSHSLIALYFGRAVSPTLWMVAHGGPPAVALPLVWAEEEMVLTFQKILNGVMAPLLPAWSRLRTVALEMLRYDDESEFAELERLRAAVPKGPVPSNPRRLAARFRDHQPAPLPRP